MNGFPFPAGFRPALYGLALGLVLLGRAAPPSQGPTAPGAYVGTPLFVSQGTNAPSYPIYRIPAMVTTTDGTVIAVADGRQAQADIPNPIDCVCRRSFDNGQTWRPLQVIADYGSHPGPQDVDTYPAYGLTNPIPRRCASDSSLLLDRTNGRVWLLYDNGAPAVGQRGRRAIKLEMRYSNDNGASWSSRLDVEALNPGLRPPKSAAAELLASPGNGIQLAGGPHAGRLIFPVYIHGGPYYSTVIYSDDHGGTWRLGGNAGSGGGEIQVAELPEGGLLASMRNNKFPWRGVRTFSRSPDGGLTWDTTFTNTVNPPVLPDPGCQASLLRLTTTHQGDASPLVFANCANASARVALTLRLSYDEGRTWPVSHLVYAGVSGYSALTQLADGKVGLLNEVDRFARIDFVSVNVSALSSAGETRRADRPGF